MLELIQANPVLFTFLGTATGSLGVALINYLLNRKKNDDDSATQLRKEMWDELKELRQRIDHLEAQNEVWRDRTYKAEDNLAILRQKLLSKGCSDCIKLVQPAD